MLWWGSKFLEVCLSQVNSATAGPWHSEPRLQGQTLCAHLVNTEVQRSAMNTLCETVNSLMCPEEQLGWPGSQGSAAHHRAGSTDTETATPNSTRTVQTHSAQTSPLS